MNRLITAGFLGVAGLALALSSCPKWRNTGVSDGGVFGSYEAPYIVLKQSGGVITDVYKLPHSLIQNENDRWLFRDGAGHPINISGDLKSIRLQSENDPLWDCYHEYHMEYETQTYQEKHATDMERCKQLR